MKFRVKIALPVNFVHSVVERELSYLIHWCFYHTEAKRSTRASYWYTGKLKEIKCTKLLAAKLLSWLPSLLVVPTRSYRLRDIDR